MFPDKKMRDEALRGGAMSKLVLEGHIVVPGKHLKAVMAELPTHIKLTRREEGCLRFEVTQDPENQLIFSVYEEFVDRAAFEAHQQRVRIADWGKIAVNAERHYKITELD